MTRVFRILACGFLCLTLSLFTTAAPAVDQNDWKRFNLELEGGPVWQTKMMCASRGTAEPSFPSRI